MDKTHPDTHQELFGTQAIEKIKKLVDHASTCFFATEIVDRSLKVTPMAIQDVDDAGSLWFLSGRSSHRNQAIGRDARVQLLLANPGNSEFLTLQGRAVVSDDPALKEKYWTALAKAWFEGGVDDPELTVIQVLPEDGHYWDTKAGRMITLLKMATSAVTGNPADIGREGKIRP